MGLRTFLGRRMRDTRWVLALLTLLLAASVSIFLFLQRGRDLPAALLTNRVLLYLLWNLDAILIVAVLFILGRNLAKLLLERHHRILGAKFRTRLLASYFGLTLGPVLLLFLSGTNLIRMSSDRTFAAPVRDVLEKGSQVGQALHREIEHRTANEAQQAVRGLAGIPVGDPLERPRLDRQMRLLLAQLQLDYLAVFDGLEFVQAVVEPRSGLTDLPEPGRALLTEALREGSATRPAAPIGAGAHMTFGAVLQPSTRTLLVAGRRIDPAVARQSEDLIQSFQSFRQLELQRPQLAASA
jgi:two-component system, NtrC family, nitrogen regulation sensor histidine kinase NtrY